MSNTMKALYVLVVLAVFVVPSKAYAIEILLSGGETSTSTQSSYNSTTGFDDPIYQRIGTAWSWSVQSVTVEMNASSTNTVTAALYECADATYTGCISVAQATQDVGTTRAEYNFPLMYITNPSKYYAFLFDATSRSQFYGSTIQEFDFRTTFPSVNANFTAIRSLSMAVFGTNIAPTNRHTFITPQWNEATSTPITIKYVSRLSADSGITTSRIQFRRMDCESCDGFAIERPITLGVSTTTYTTYLPDGIYQIWVDYEDSYGFVYEFGETRQFIVGDENSSILIQNAINLASSSGIYDTSFYSTSTLSNVPEIQCSIVDLGTCVASVFAFLFVPSQHSLQQFSSLKTQLYTKFPFSYSDSVSELWTSFSATTTATTGAYYNFPTGPNGAVSSLKLFDLADVAGYNFVIYLRGILSAVLYLLLGFYVIRVVTRAV